ncbi:MULTISPECIES: hypothetical protein [unclassified Arthrobacter]|uniref:hypothetical protein n=1 Tax=unclassified Arthrobacter TaxID=235627 RepID=UPI00254F7988|nr:hypothetical protein [Arthrobacter sp. fls2-241-R2A-172]
MSRELATWAMASRPVILYRDPLPPHQAVRKINPYVTHPAGVAISAEKFTADNETAADTHPT